MEKLVVCISGTLNIRKTPEIKPDNIVGTLKKDDRFYVNDFTTENGGWFKLKNGQGWVYANLCKEINESRPELPKSVIFVPSKDVKIEVVNKNIKAVKRSNCINAGFFWAGKPNAIVMADGKVICESASHAWRGYPQSVIYRTSKGVVGIKRCMSTKDLPEDTEFAIGGLGVKTPYGYSPAAEGFSGKYSDVLRPVDKTFIGYVKGSDKFVMGIAHNIEHKKLIDHINGIGLDFAISLDGGGSTQMKVNNEIIDAGDGRAVNTIIYW